MAQVYLLWKIYVLPKLCLEGNFLVYIVVCVFNLQPCDRNLFSGTPAKDTDHK